MQRRIPLGRVTVSLTLIALVAAVAALSLVVSAGAHGGHGAGAVGPFPRDFVDIHDVPPRPGFGVDPAVGGDPGGPAG